MKSNVLLWLGRHLEYFSGDSHQSLLLPERGDQSDAIVDFIASLTPRPKSIKLVFYFHDITAFVYSPAPKAGKNVLRRTLSVRFPDLGTTHACWGLLGVQSIAGAGHTVLLQESRPRLLRLRQALAEHKVNLAGAWPLTSLLEKSKPFSIAGSPAIFALLLKEFSFLHFVDLGGHRITSAFNGSASFPEFSSSLSHTIGTYDLSQMPPIFLSGQEPETAELVSLIGQNDHKLIELADIIHTHADSLTAQDIGNFLPLPPAVSPNTILTAVGLSGLAVAVAWGLIYYKDIRQYDSDHLRKQATIARLTSQVRQLEANKEAYLRAEAFVSEARPNNSAAIVELIAACAKRPIGITIRSIKVDEGTFTIEAYLHDGLDRPNSDYHRFFADLSKGTSWRIPAESKLATVSTPSFAISGVFQ